MLQNREVDICVRMGMVLNLSKEIQIAVDHGELFQIDELLEHFGEMDSLLEMQKQMEKIRLEKMNTVARCARCFAHFQN